MGPIDIFERATKVSIGKFASLFSTFKATAFRLEVLPAFSVSDEEEPLKRFMAGDSMPSGFNSAWHDLLNAARDRGAEVRRLRIVPRTPSTYLKFEIHWGYRPSSSFGEKVNFTYEDRLPNAVRNLPMLIDFWAFDQAVVFPMIYDYQGKFLGALELDSVDTHPFLDVALCDFSTCPDLSWAATEYAPA